MRLLNENDVYKLFNRRGMAQLHVGDIDVLPRVDAKEVIHAKWIRRPSNSSQVYCSNCAMILKGIAEGFYYCFYYCPNCGAKMDLEETND